MHGVVTGKIPLHWLPKILDSYQGIAFSDAVTNAESMAPSGAATRK
jgi:hypothetical protein